MKRGIYMYSFRYNLTLDDYINFKVFNYYNSKNSHNLVTIIRIISTIVVFLVPIITKKMINLNLFIISLIIGALYFALFKKVFNIKIKKNIKNMLDENESAHLLIERKLFITDNDIQDNVENNKRKTRWNDITKIYEDEKYIFIYLGTVQAYIIPKYLFVNIAEESKFKLYLKNRYDATRKIKT